MKYLKQIFESQDSESLEIKKLCDKYIKGNYDIVNGEINSSYELSLNVGDMDHIPIKFRRVRSMFIKGDIKSLKNSPEIVLFFNISGCSELKSLEDGPEYVGRFLHLGTVELENLNGFPKIYVDDYTLTVSPFFNKLLNILKLFLNPIIEGGKAKRGYFIIDQDALDTINLFNEYDPLRENDVIILDRFNDFLIHIGKEPVKDISGYKII